MRRSVRQRDHGPSALTQTGPSPSEGSLSVVSVRKTTKRHCYLLGTKQVVWRAKERGRRAPDASSALHAAGKGVWRTGPSSRHSPCRSSRRQAPDRGLQQGACLRGAQLYLSGWKAQSQGGAAWGPRHQTSLSTRGPSSGPGPSGGLLLRPETRSSHCNTSTTSIPQTPPARPVSTKGSKAAGPVPGPDPAAGRLGH